MAKRPTIPPFTAPAGGTLFVFEDGMVYVFGEAGAEAAIPAADLAAFLEHLDEEISSSLKSGPPEEEP